MRYSENFQGLFSCQTQERLETVYVFDPLMLNLEE